MDQEKQQAVIFCPNGHENMLDAQHCDECGLPVINCAQEIDTLIRRFSDKSSYFVPYIESSFIGIGTMGKQVITDLYSSFGGEVAGVSFLNIDSMEGDGNVPEINTKGVRFYQHIISGSAVGGMIYCGLGEQAALHDSELESYLHMSGIRREDASQAIFVTTSIGGGTGSGIGPVTVDLCKSCNQKASILAVAVVPSGNEADHVHLNAFYGISKLITYNGAINADMILLLSYDKLRHLRGVGRSGEELKADKVVTYLLRLFELDLYQSGIIRLTRLSRGSKIQVFVPCLAIGRSMEIFGDLKNVLESAAAYPMANVNFENVMASYLLLRIPRRLAANFPEELVTEAFEFWNRKHLPFISSSMIQVLRTDEQSDRVDVCILLGGDDINSIIGDTVKGYHRFKVSLEGPSEWEEYGLTEQSATEAEQVIAKYDQSMQVLRASKRSEA